MSCTSYCVFQSWFESASGTFAFSHFSHLFSFTSSACLICINLTINLFLNAQKSVRCLIWVACMWWWFVCMCEVFFWGKKFVKSNKKTVKVNFMCVWVLDCGVISQSVVQALAGCRWIVSVESGKKKLPSELLHDFITPWLLHDLETPSASLFTVRSTSRCHYDPNYLTCLYVGSVILKWFHQMEQNQSQKDDEMKNDWMKTN